MQIASLLGKIVLMSKVEVIALMYPGIPLTLLVLLTIILFVTAVTIQVT